MIIKKQFLKCPIFFFFEGTLDGANIEIRDAIGKENMFIFGALADEIDGFALIVFIFFEKF